jgi:hypothetical protein
MGLDFAELRIGRLYGRGRSVSVGDVVAVDGVDYFCASTGWRQLL